MTDIIDREELELRLARRLNKAQMKALKELLELLGDPPDWYRVPQAFWDASGKALVSVIGPIIEEIYVMQAEAMLAGFAGIGVEWDLINQAAVDWARAHAADLVGKLMQRSYEFARQAVADFFEQGWTMGDLEARLARVYGAQRAEVIAVTEVTRAAVEGERATVKELEKYGIFMIEIWQTENDELVCPICGPRHEKREGDGWTRDDGPPAHPKCRCWVNHVMKD